MTMIKVGVTADFAGGKITPVKADGRDLLLASVGGAIYATARKCPHMGADLCQGQIAGGAIVCPKHGAAFSLSSGEPVTAAKILFLKTMPKPLAIYPVTIEGDDVFVTIA